jgi:uncharacterized Tic20 family protein
MTIEIACPSCAAQLKAPEQLIGKVVKCPRCTARVVVQETPSAPAAAAAAPSSAATTNAPRAPAPPDLLEPLDDEPEEEQLDELPEVDEEEPIDEVVAADDEDDDYDDEDDDRRERRRPRKKAKPRRRSFAPTKDERTAAMLLYVLGILTGFIGSIILWVIKRDSRFVDHHGKQALNFAITLWIAAGVLLIIGVPVAIFTFLIGLIIIIPLFFALNVGAIIICILQAMKAGRGEWSEIAASIKFFQ